MEILSRNDLFRLKNQTLVAEYDFDTLVTLYQPIIGYTAVSVFMMLWSLTKHSTSDAYYTHETLLSRMRINPGEFIKARKKLEGANLLKTTLKKSVDGVDVYTYAIRTPETPKNFFKNVLLYGLFQRVLGEEEGSKIKCLYRCDETEDDGTDISASMSKIFDQDEDRNLMKLLDDRDELVGRIRARVKIQFDYELFINFITSSSQIRKTSFTSEHLKEIERIAALYGVSEEHMADIVIDNFVPGVDSDNRFNFEGIIKQCMEEEKFPFLKKCNDNASNGLVSSSTQLGSKINLMESYSPKDYLRVRQHDTKVVSSDLYLLESLSKDLNLAPGVINALIDYVLETNNNVLSKNYVMKIGASLVREKIQTTYDAMVFLKKTNHTSKPSYKEMKDKRKIEVEQSSTPGANSDALWEEMLKKMGEYDGKN